MKASRTRNGRPIILLNGTWISINSCGTFNYRVTVYLSSTVLSVTTLPQEVNENPFP